jgi:plasmid stability protein
MLAPSGMTQLLVRNVPDSLAKKLKLRAVENGVSAEEEHRRILRAALEKPASETKPKRTLYDAFIELGQIAPDFEFEQKRTRSKRRPLDL